MLIAFKRNLPNAGFRCRSKMIVFERTSLGLFVALAYVFKNSSANASNLGTSRSGSESTDGFSISSPQLALILLRARSSLHGRAHPSAPCLSCMLMPPMIPPTMIAPIHTKKPINAGTLLFGSS